MSATSADRVRAALDAAGLTLDIQTMPASTRTAEEAAAACGCDVGDIVKSLIFKGTESGNLVLLLVSGANQVDLDKAAAAIGEPLARADAKEVRARTGFAIGGVAPLGHLAPVSTWIDETLLERERLWAAAGAPNAVFPISPSDLVAASGARSAISFSTRDDATDGHRPELSDGALRSRGKVDDILLDANKEPRFSSNS